MPVTAKLSRAFYEALGEDVANELVDWFNAVDLTYRAQLRDLNDANWERFRAVTASKADLERFATKADLEWFATKADLERFATKADLERFATKADLERFATKDDLERFAARVEERFATKDDLERFAARVEDRFATKADLDRFATKAELAEVEAELMKWMFVFWAATVAPLAGLIVAMHTFFVP